uniref:NmrA-like domain-containing protein n=1 Tax=Chondria sp. (in: red algae) TaxID=1982705 RepID=A0A1Z1MCN9_9FLOR|nr:hypothetical protein [Chondria sp. (in: red algae)]
MSLLIVGSTGTLGRQVVRQALNDGFQVKCLVRNFRKASFLKEWGAELIYGDLTSPETIPLALYGITGVIDCSTTRPNDDVYSVEIIDLKSKYILIESAVKANIRHYIFFSLLNFLNYQDISIIRLKLLVESRLRNTKINYTVFYVSGFFQGLIPQYAVPILDQNSVWITSELSSIPYVNTQDIALIVIRSLAIVQFNNKGLPLVGNKTWTSLDIIKLCEKISGKRAKIAKVPIYLLKFMMYITKFFQWTWNVSERLAFIEILSKNYNINISMNELLDNLKIQEDSLESLENYLQEYFQRIMKKLKELNYQTLSNQTLDKTNF